MKKLSRKSQGQKGEVNPSASEPVLETNSTRTPNNTGSNANDDFLMEKVIARGNIISALNRVEKGAPGIDEMRTQDLREHLVKMGATLREELAMFTLWISIWNLSLIGSTTTNSCSSCETGYEPKDF